MVQIASCLVGGKVTVFCLCSMLGLCARLSFAFKRTWLLGSLAEIALKKDPFSEVVRFIMILCGCWETVAVTGWIFVFLHRAEVGEWMAGQLGLK